MHDDFLTHEGPWMSWWCAVPRMSFTLKPVGGAQVTSSQRQNHGGPCLLMPLVGSSRLQGLLDCEAVPLGLEGP